MRGMAEDEIRRKIWLGGYLVELVLVRHDEACGYVLSELVMADGRYFSMCPESVFTQWVYLACPEAFKMALVGTRWENSNKEYLKASKILLDKDRLYLEFTVRLVMAACTGDGICFDTRVFRLCFTELT